MCRSATRSCSDNRSESLWRPARDLTGGEVLAGPVQDHPNGGIGETSPPRPPPRPRRTRPVHRPGPRGGRGPRPGTPAATAGRDRTASASAPAPARSPAANRASARTGRHRSPAGPRTASPAIATDPTGGAFDRVRSHARFPYVRDARIAGPDHPGGGHSSHVERVLRGQRLDRTSDRVSYGRTIRAIGGGHDHRYSLVPRGTGHFAVDAEACGERAQTAFGRPIGPGATPIDRGRDGKGRGRPADGAAIRGRRRGCTRAEARPYAGATGNGSGRPARPARPTLNDRPAFIEGRSKGERGYRWDRSPRTAGLGGGGSTD